jgi:hypothetical protein
LIASAWSPANCATAGRVAVAEVHPARSIRSKHALHLEENLCEPLDVLGVGALKPKLLVNASRATLAAIAAH